MKHIRTVMLVLCALLALSACGSADNGKTDDGSADSGGKTITVSTADITAAIVKDSGAAGVDTTISKGDELYEASFASLYTLDESLITDGSIAYDSTGATADEISVLRVKDTDSIDTVKTALEQRIKQRASDFGGYKPEETAKVEDGKIFSSNNYIMLAICDDSTAARSAFMTAMQQAANQ